MLGDVIGGVADLGAAGLNAWSTDKANEFAWKKQKKVLQNQVQWRVDDAVKAGLHPLAALGLNPASGPTALAPDLSGVSSAGANIGRAVEAMADPSDKLAGRLALQAFTRGELENDLLRANLASAQKALLNQPGSPPGVKGGGVVLPSLFGNGIKLSDAELGNKAQSAAGELGDVLIAPDILRQVVSSPGNIGDPALASDVRSVIQYGKNAWDTYKDWVGDVVGVKQR